MSSIKPDRDKPRAEDIVDAEGFGVGVVGTPGDLRVALRMNGIDGSESKAYAFTTEELIEFMLAIEKAVEFISEFPGNTSTRQENATYH